MRCGYPVHAPGRTLQVRVRPGFQPGHPESFQPEIVSFDDLRELARLLGESLDQGKSIAWARDPGLSRISVGTTR